MRLNFMRHGHTNYNALQLCNDSPEDPVHLSTIGKYQARKAATQLQHTPLDLMFVSELARTRETAEFINCFHSVPVITKPEINDIRSGFNGKPVAEYQQAIARDPLHTSLNGGESLLQHKQRIVAFLDWLVQQPQHNILVIAHEETMRVFVAYFEQIPDREMLKVHFENCQIISYDI